MGEREKLEEENRKGGEERNQRWRREKLEEERKRKRDVYKKKGYKRFSEIGGGEGPEKGVGDEDEIKGE